MDETNVGKHRRGVTSKNQLALPPREISSWGRWVLMLRGKNMQIGLTFLGMGIMGLLLALRTYLTQTAQDRDGKWIAHTGTVEKVEARRSSRNGTTYYYEFSYEIGGEFYHRRDIGPKDYAQEGETVPIFYLDIDHEAAHIEGMRGVLPFWVVLLLLIFPAIGGVLVLLGFIQNRRALRLYREGEFAWGRLLEQQATSKSVNKRKVWAFLFEFEASDGKIYQAKAETTNTELLTDEEEELILYLKDNPEYNIVYDAEERAPHIVADGSLEPRVEVLSFFVFGVFLVSLLVGVLLPTAA